MFDKKYSDLFQRIKFTLIVILIYRFGSFVPIAGIDAIALEELIHKNQAGILGMFNVLSGGSLGRMSIFALTLSPYITASILLQLVSVAYKPLENLRKEGEAGRRKLNQISRLLTVVFAIFQGYTVALWLLGVATSSGSVVVLPELLFKLTTVTTLVIGTVFLMWLGEQINAKGLGNGSSVIIFVSIISGIPSGVISLFELMRKGSISPFIGIIAILSIVTMIAIVVFFETAVRKVVIHYPQHRTRFGEQAQDSSFIPLKLNTSGVIPPIFAASVLLLPVTVTNLAQGRSATVDWIAFHLGHGKPLYIVLYGLLIVSITFIFTAIVFNADEVSDGLKRNSAFVMGVRPGKKTAEYFDFVLSRITAIGALYLCGICVLPEIFINKYALSLSLSGTSIMIVVNVVMDTIGQIHAYTMNSKYANVMHKQRIKRR